MFMSDHQRLVFNFQATRRGTGWFLQAIAECEALKKSIKSPILNNNNATTQFVLRVMINWNLWLVTEPLSCIFQKYLAAHTHFVACNLAESERNWKERDPTRPLLLTEVRSLYAKFHASEYGQLNIFEICNLRVQLQVTSFRFSYTEDLGHNCSVRSKIFLLPNSIS